MGIPKEWKEIMMSPRDAIWTNRTAILTIEEER